MKVVLKANNKLSAGITPGTAIWGSIKGDIANQQDLIEYVDGKIAEIEISGGSGITEEELEAKGYLTSIPEEYITEEELNAKGYLVEHQDISHLATKDELSGYQVAGDYLTSIPEEYMTFEKTQDMLRGAVPGYCNQYFMAYKQDYFEPELNKKLESVPEEYITEDELNAKEYVTRAELNTTIGDINTLLDEIIGE